MGDTEISQSAEYILVQLDKMKISSVNNLD